MFSGSLVQIANKSSYILSGITMLLLLAGCASLFPEHKEEKYSAKNILKNANFPHISFEAEIVVVGDEKMKPYFESIAKLMDKNILPPISTNALRFRTEMDLRLLRKALKNKGYFDGDVQASMVAISDGQKVTITVKTGPRYTIGGVHIDIEQEGGILPESEKYFCGKVRKIINVNSGDPVELDRVFDSVLELIRYFQGRGYPLVDISEPRGKIDLDHKTMTLEYKINLKSIKNFGPIELSGLEHLSQKYARNRIHFEPGDRYDIRKIDQSRRELLDTELFSSITFTPDLEKGAEKGAKEIPVKVDLIEAPPRAIGAGIRFATQEGIGGRLYWQHKNLLGNGERLILKTEGSQKQLGALIGIEKPDFFFRDASLEGRLEFLKADTKAFEGEVYDGYIGLKHRLDDSLTYLIGAQYEQSHLKQERVQTKSFVGIPMVLILDQSNDIINPYKGWKVKIEGIPYFGDIGENKNMFKISAFSAQYWRFTKKDQFVIATWERVSQIFSSPLAKIPLNKRLYSGGANSVRGYGFQRLGPISVHGKPTGGQSQLEGGIEPRFRVGENLGISAFVEAGRISSRRDVKGLTRAERKSEMSNRFMVGYGAGIKYYTEIGPIRLDFAFPTKRRKFGKKHYDDPVQVYASIGQSF